MKHISNKIGIGLAVLGMMFATTSALAGGYPDLSIEQLKEAMEADSVVLLDANGAARYATGHIPGAIDYSSVKDLSTQLPKSKDTLIVAYCGGPRCSAYMKPASVAKSLGYTNVKHLSAGISGWKEAGMPVETKTGN